MAEPARSLKVFVSYSRTDVDFADQLVLALEDKGFEAILDRHDLSGGENWRERLGKLILSADAVAFVLTAKSASSEICAWEVEEARRLGKRILPVTIGSIDGVTPPTALGELNWIPFYADPAIPGSGFYYGVKRLMEALSVDLDWLRDQTRYSERAAEWQRAKADDLLLRGAALKDAEGWLARTPAGSAPPASVRDYLTASGDVEQQRQIAAKAQLQEREEALKQAEAAISDKQQAQKRVRQISMWALIAGLVLLAIAIPGNYFATTRTLDANDRRAAIFADAANEMTRKGDYAKAMLLALAGDPAARTGLLESLLRPNGNLTARSALVRAYAGDNLLFSMDTNSPVTAMIGLSDGNRFATFHADKKVRIWELGKDTPVVLDLPEAVRDAVGLEFDPDYFEDETRPALADMPDLVLLRWDDPARPPSLWSLVTNKEVQVLKLADATPPRATAIGAADTGNAVIVGYDDGRVVMWRLGIDKPLFEYQLENREPAVVVGLMAEDNMRFAAGDESGFVTAVDVADGVVEDVSRHRVDPEGILSLSPLSDEEMFVSGTATGRIGIHDPGMEDDEVAMMPGFTAELGRESIGIAKLILTSEQKLLMFLSTQGQAKIVRAQSGVAMDPLNGRTDVHFAAFVPEAGALATASRQGSVYIWALAKADTRSNEWSYDSRPSVAPNGRNLIVMDEKSVRVVAFGNKKPLRELAFAGITATALSPDGMTAVVAGNAGLCVFRIDNTDACRILEPKRDDTAIRDIQFSPDGQEFMARTRNYEAKIWSVETGQVLVDLNDTQITGPVALSVDAQYVLHVVDDKATLLHASDGVVTTLTAGGEVLGVAFSPDGKHIALSFRDGGVQLWLIGGERPEQIFRGHEHPVRAVVFDHTGELLLSGGEDGAAKLWSLGERDYLQRFELTEDSVEDVAIEADNGHVILTSDESISRWTVNPIIVASKDDQMKLACERLSTLGAEGFTPRDRLDYPFLKGVADNPCGSLGFAMAKPVAKPAPAKPAPAAGAAP